MTIEIPEELRPYLGAFGPQAYDGCCGEPVGWGYKIIKHCGEELWSKLSTLGRLECLHGGYNDTSCWVLITKSLTRKEAEAQYGMITDEEFGPRGGWKSVAFGNKKFMSKTMRPTE